MRVDVHNHAIPQAALDLFADEPGYGVRVEDGRWRGGNHVDFELLAAFVDPEAKLAQLHQNGIDGAIVSVAPPLFYYELPADLATPLARATNAGLEDFHSSAPDRVWWMAHAPIQEPELAAEILREAAGRPGCVGIEVGSSIAGERLDEQRFEPFWAAAERLGLPVLIHPDPTYTDLEPLKPYYLNNVIGMPLETTIAVKRILAAGVLDRHPDVNVVLVHAGGYFPYQAGRLRHAASVRPELSAPLDPWSYGDQLWFDVIAHDAQALSHLVSRMGVDRVVLGTDLPFDMALPDPVAHVREAVGAELLERIAEVNPARLYGLDRAKRGPRADADLSAPAKGGKR